MDGRDDLRVPLTTRFWVALARSYRRVYRRHTRVLAPLGATVPQFDLLATLYRSPPEGLRMGEISERLLVTEGNVTGLVDRLESAGMVERGADPADRRALRVRLTPRGRDVAERAIPIVEAELEQVFAEISPEELRATQRLLRRIRRASGDEG